MARRLRFDQRAVQDLADIRGYLLERSVTGADNVRTHIAATLEALIHFPHIGRATDHPSVRVLPLKRYPYLLFYTVTDDEVIVLHIRHGARRPPETGEL